MHLCTAFQKFSLKRANVSSLGGLSSQDEVPVTLGPFGAGAKATLLLTVGYASPFNLPGMLEGDNNSGA